MGYSACHSSTEAYSRFTDGYPNCLGGHGTMLVNLKVDSVSFERGKKKPYLLFESRENKEHSCCLLMFYAILHRCV